jgi:hypothetical protein
MLVVERGQEDGYVFEQVVITFRIKETLSIGIIYIIHRGRGRRRLELPNLRSSQVLQKLNDAVTRLQGAAGPPERRGTR